MDKLIYGSEVSKRIKEDVFKEVSCIIAKGYNAPTLAVVIVGDDEASKVYVASKEKASQSVGFNSRIIRLSTNTSQEELIEVVSELNQDKNVNGILVQMPLPKQISEDEVIKLIDYKKDVDGLHPYNIGLLHLNKPLFVPCTPLGIITLLDEMNVKYDGLNAVVIGRSKLVGLPIAKLLESKNCTVTICHSHTKNIKEICQRADILVVAIGKAKYIDSSWIKQGAYVIDVGINRVDGKVVGDVELESMIDVVSYITPVPKGVGPMTIAMLLQNTLKAYKLQNGGQDD